MCIVTKKEGMAAEGKHTAIAFIALPVMCLQALPMYPHLPVWDPLFYEKR